MRRAGRAAVTLAVVVGVVLGSILPAWAAVAPGGTMDLGNGGSATVGSKTCANYGATVGQAGIAPYGGSAAVVGSLSRYFECDSSLSINAGTNGWGIGMWVSIPSMSTNCTGNDGCVLVGIGGGNWADGVVVAGASGTLGYAGVSGCGYVNSGPYLTSGTAFYLGVTSSGPGNFNVLYNGATVASCSSSSFSSPHLYIGVSGDGFWDGGGQTMIVQDLSYWLGYQPTSADLNAAKTSASGGGGGSTTTTTAAGGGGGGGGGSTCGGPGQPACNTNISADSGGFFGGLSSAIGGALGGVTSGITGAISSAVSSVVSGMSTALTSLFVPSSGTQAALGSVWSGITTKAPFSVVYEIVTFLPVSLLAVKNGVAAGPVPCASSGTHLCVGDALSSVAAQPGVTLIRACEVVVLALGFIYGIYRAVNGVIDK